MSIVAFTEICFQKSEAREAFTHLHAGIISDSKASWHRVTNTPKLTNSKDKLKGIISSKFTQMLRLNNNRMNYSDKFQQMVDEYNADPAMGRYSLPVWWSLPENSTLMINVKSPRT